MMNIESLIKNEKLKSILKSYNDTKIEKEKLGYNLFTLSSYNNQLENFHSDVICSLLNPDGLHEEGYKYLHFFLEYLNKCMELNIAVSDFKNTIVNREQGRLDIWIRDIVSKKSIIIENKINNAPDMDEQIERYFNYAKSKGFDPISILYLSLDGSKLAPPSDDESKAVTTNIAAFNNGETDLVSGWLSQCWNATPSHENKNGFSIIFQYSQLIKHLANKSMDNKTLTDFCEIIGTKESLDTINDTNEIISNIPEFRRKRFAAEIKDFAPFKKSFQWGPAGFHILQGILKESDFKVHIEFKKDGNISIRFWTPTMTETLKGQESLKNILESIGLIEDFTANENFGFLKDFSFNEATNNINKIDTELLEFMKIFLSRLKEQYKK